MAKIDYEPTFDLLRKRDLTESGDVLIVCAEAPSAASVFWGGAIGAALTSSSRGHAVLAVSEDRIRIFDVDKATGEYLETMAEFNRENLRKVKTTLSGEIIIKGTDGDAHFTVPKKFKGFDQKEARQTAFGILKTSFGKV